MHRLMSGEKIEDLAAAQAGWIEAGRSVATYCNKREWDVFVDDLGVLVHQGEDGFQLRRHASIKCTARGGSRKIVHNRVIVGNPSEYEKWKADQRSESEKGYMAQWTYYTDSEFEGQLSYAVNEHP